MACRMRDATDAGQEKRVENIVRYWVGGEAVDGNEERKDSREKGRRAA